MFSATLIAISLLHPKMPENYTKQIADAIDKQAIVAGVDTLAFVAIAEHESKFASNVVSDDGEDWGLLQIRARYYKGKKEWLLDPVANIKAGAYIIKVSVDMCRKHLGREPMMREYMTLYGGEGSKSFCRPTKLSTTVERFRDCLLNAVYSTTDISECKKVYYESN